MNNVALLTGPEMDGRHPLGRCGAERVTRAWTPLGPPRSGQRQGPGGARFFPASPQADDGIHLRSSRPAPRERSAASGSASEPPRPVVNGAAWPGRRAEGAEASMHRFCPFSRVWKITGRGMQAYLYKRNRKRACVQKIHTRVFLVSPVERLT